MEVKEGLLESIQDNNNTEKIPVSPQIHIEITLHCYEDCRKVCAKFSRSGYFERTWLCHRQPQTMLSDTVEICVLICVLSSSLLILPGADEDGESPELTTSRPLPKIPFTIAAPRVETTTLNKIQNKIPAQTKVCFVFHCVLRLL